MTVCEFWVDLQESRPSSTPMTPTSMRPNLFLGLTIDGHCAVSELHVFEASQGIAAGPCMASCCDMDLYHWQTYTNAFLGTDDN